MIHFLELINVADPSQPNFFPPVTLSRELLRRDMALTCGNITYPYGVTLRHA